MACSQQQLPRSCNPCGTVIASSGAPAVEEVLVEVVPARGSALISLPALRRRLIERLESDGCQTLVVVIDTTRVEFLNGVGLEMLIEVCERAELQGITVHLMVTARPVYPLGPAGDKVKVRDGSG